MNCLNTQELSILESLELWLEDNVDQGTNISFDDGVMSSHCLPVLAKVIASLKPKPFTSAMKRDVEVKKSHGFDVVRCSRCNENDNFAIMTDGTVECANCGHTKGHLAIHAHG